MAHPDLLKQVGGDNSTTDLGRLFAALGVTTLSAALDAIAGLKLKYDEALVDIAALTKDNAALVAKPQEPSDRELRRIAAKRHFRLVHTPVIGDLAKDLAEDGSRTATHVLERLLDALESDDE